jgi:hypothetical protein
VAHPRVAEAAVVGRPHEIKGESVFAYVVCRGPRPAGDTSALVKELRDWVGEQLGAIAKPDDVRFADNLPKTRSGKIMRRLLRAIARGEEITQDVSTLENPAILDQLRGVETAPAPARKARKPARRAAARSGTGRARNSSAKARGAKGWKGSNVRAGAKKRPAKRAARAGGARKRRSVTAAGRKKARGAGRRSR